MKTFTVLVESLGLVSGYARKGEIVTEEQVGPENVDRLASLSYILPASEAVPGPAPTVEENPEAPAEEEGSENEPYEREELKEWLDDAAVGLVYVTDVPDEVADYIEAVQAGEKELPFDEEAVGKLKLAEIADRIVTLGGEELPPKTKKAVAVEALKAAALAYVLAAQISEPEDSEESEEAEDAVD